MKMRIFDELLKQTLDLHDLEGLRDLAKIFEDLFEKIDMDPSEYDWEMFGLEELQDPEAVRIFCLGNLMYAAQDAGIIPSFVDLDDFDFSCDAIFRNIEEYSDVEAEDIVKGIERFNELTGANIMIE